MKVGFTGNRIGMSDYQIAELTELFSIYEIDQLHHGDCVGADAETHDIAKDMGLSTWSSTHRWTRGSGHGRKATR